MRSTFQSNMKRKLKAEVDGKKVKISWPHYNRMLFLTRSAGVSVEDENSGYGEENTGEENTDEETFVPSPHKITVKWTNDDEETLIDFFQANEELWNHRHPKYKLASKSQLSDEAVAALEHKFSRKRI